MNQLNKICPDLAETCSPFTILLKKENKWNWKAEHDEAFRNVNSEIEKKNRNKPYQTKLPTTANPQKRDSQQSYNRKKIIIGKVK